MRVKVNSFKEDNTLVSQGERPKYVVVSESIGTPFISAEMAIKWHNLVMQQGVQTTIWDLTEYDWDLNPANFKTHDIATDDGIEGLGKDLAMRNQAVIN